MDIYQTLGGENFPVCLPDEELAVEKDYSAWEVKYTLDNILWSSPKKNGIWITTLHSHHVIWWEYCNELVTIDGLSYYIYKKVNNDIQPDQDNFCADYVAVNNNKAREIIKDPSSGEFRFSGHYDDVSDVKRFYSLGKGTILWMKDDKGNEAGYDFDNLLVKLYKVTNETYPSNYLRGEYIFKPSSSHITIDEDVFIWSSSFEGTCKNNKFLSSNIDRSTLFEIDRINVCRCRDSRDEIFNNTIGYNSSKNIILSSSNCTLGNYTKNNIVVVSESANIGNYCTGNILSSGKNYIMGNYCSGNVLPHNNGDFVVKIGDFSRGIIISSTNGNIFVGPKCSSIELLNLENIYIKSNCSDFYLYKGRNITVYEGTKGKGIHTTTFPIESGVYYPQHVAMNSEGEIKVWVPGDIVN